jgi:hypothetical protein
VLSSSGTLQMAKVAPVTQTCGLCGNVFPSTSGVPVELMCPRCRQAVNDLDATGAVGAIALAPDHRQRTLTGLGLGLTVSMVLHLTLIASLSLLILEPKVLGLSLVTSLVPESPESDGEVLDMPVELADNNPVKFDGEVLQATDVLATGNSLGEMLVAGPGGMISGTSGSEIGVPDAAAGFSSIAAGRLKKHTSAKKGDYEVALFWDGPSDLDLHVLFQAIPGRTRRTINYIFRGTPTTGFLDLDQNCEQPYTDEPIEHVRWNTKKPPPGTYQVGVHGFMLRSESVRIPQQVSFTVEIKSPDGVKSYTGAVGQDDFEEIDTLAIGISSEQQQTIETQAERLLATAKEQLTSGDAREKLTARGMLKNIERKYPTTKAAKEARELLRAQK